MHRNELKVKITSVENVRKMQKIYLYDTHQEVAQVSWPGATAHQAGRLFITRIMCLTYRLADSNLTMLQLETAPEDVEEVSIDLLD